MSDGADRRCYACDRSDEGPRARCECGDPLWFPVREPDEWPGASAEGGPSTPPGAGIRRYGSLLPVDPAPADLGAGGTPLIRAGRLDEVAGCRVWLKDEGQNPTGSFKDRGSAVGVAAVVGESGHERVGTVSHGNMALSTAAHAAAAGVECVVLVPADVPAARLSAIARFDPTIVRVRGDYGRLYRDALALGPERGIRFVNSDVPLRVAGQKTLAYELLDAAPDLDAIVLPVSSGGNASAVWKGLREGRAAGLVDELPRLYLVQAAACDPIASAFRRDEGAVTPTTPGETVAYSIANPDPPSGTRALAAVRDTGGAVVSVGDEGIRAARDRLARRAGVRAEAAAATPLVALDRLTDAGEIADDEAVACVVTGRGYGGTDGSEPDTPVVDRDGLAAALDA
ncbi:pyridoxal-phosphate dependent enzyme [Halovivax sp.]|uniref:threonine synthase n=1 Tax=Halovivax sp. TaxID=1935978 RepID=UPI0025B80AC6|nr:pyridoxal-phosphate dependent enzyme [Halovivax sp.]